MDARSETTTDEGLWVITEIEATARDILDVGVWEVAEEEERISLDAEFPVSSDAASAPAES